MYTWYQLRNNYREWQALSSKRRLIGQCLILKCHFSLFSVHGFWNHCKCLLICVYLWSSYKIYNYHSRYQVRITISTWSNSYPNLNRYQTMYNQNDYTKVSYRGPYLPGDSPTTLNQIRPSPTSRLEANLDSWKSDGISGFQTSFHWILKNGWGNYWNLLSKTSSDWVNFCNDVIFGNSWLSFPWV